ncbi:MAG TPA: T9SS type A sorting domain-containing protein [Flavobacterium sp.]|nr:T9SS type A sorting domain-containing protein [Flavobacterium sp.]
MKKLLLLLVFATAIAHSQVSIGTPGNVDTNAGLTTPISNWYASSLSQFIYLASEMGTSGSITAIQFTLNNTTPLANSNDQIDVWIGHTTVSSYNPVVSPTGADWIPIATHQHVVANGSLTQVGSLVTFTFDTPFVYNGTDNIVITVDANELGDDGSGVLYYQTAASAAKMCLMIRADIAADNADPNNPPLNYTGGTAAGSVQAKNTRPIITFQGLLGIAQNTAITKTELYPNPVTTDLFIKSATTVTNATIYDIQGKLVKATKIEQDKINTASLPSGTYILNLNLEDGKTLTQKFIKQ